MEQKTEISGTTESFHDTESTEEVRFVCILICMLACSRQSGFV